MRRDSRHGGGVVTVPWFTEPPGSPPPVTLYLVDGWGEVLFCTRSPEAPILCLTVWVRASAAPVLGILELQPGEMTVASSDF